MEQSGGIISMSSKVNGTISVGSAAFVRKKFIKIAYIQKLFYQYRM